MGSITNEHNRTLLKHALLTPYFPTAPATYATEENGLVVQIVQQILHESPASYQQKVNTMDEEEVFVRSGVFKKVIPKAYNYTCSISRMRLIADRDIQMIDACHIVPFSHSHDDTISNGI
jgi:putative restriction endonuclease